MGIFRPSNVIKEDFSNLLAAKVKQEEAIAERIRNSEQVEIEEYYDNSNTGNVGVEANLNGINTGFKTGNQRISKRLIRFIGHDSS